MKKIILSIVAVMAFGFANAQDKKEMSEGFSKGDIFVSGSFGVSSEKTGDFKTTGFEIKPTLGFFVTENIALGASLGFESTKQTATPDDIKTTDLSFNVFGRYYCTPANKFSVFGQLEAGYLTSKVEQGDASAKSNGFGLGLGLGVNYFLSSNWAMEAGWAGLNYQTSKPDADGAEKTDTFGLNLDLSSINFGLLYKF